MKFIHEYEKDLNNFQTVFNINNFVIIIADVFNTCIHVLSKRHTTTFNWLNCEDIFSLETIGLFEL